MNRAIALACLTVPILFAGSLKPVAAQIFTIDVDGGMSQPVGTEMTHWKTGFNVGTNVFFWPASRIGIGLRAGYDRWTPDKAKYINEAGVANAGQLLDAQVTGSTTIVEIMPSMRLATGYNRSPINFFGQVGTGLFAIRTTSNVTGLVSGEQRAVEFANGTWVGRWGFQVGPGVSIGSAERFTVDLFSLYNVAFNGNHVFQYFIGNAGVSLKF